MTLHVYYEHKCPACQAFFIPFEPGVPCPNCGRAADEVFDFVPQAASSLEFNLKTYGSYAPPAWYVGSLGDHCLRLLFTVFEAFRTREDPAEDFETCLDRKLASLDWGGQLYFEKHLRALALKVHAAMGTA